VVVVAGTGVVVVGIRVKLNVVNNVESFTGVEAAFATVCWRESKLVRVVNKLFVTGLVAGLVVVVDRGLEAGLVLVVFSGLEAGLVLVVFCCLEAGLVLVVCCGLEAGLVLVVF